MHARLTPWYFSVATVATLLLSGSKVLTYQDVLITGVPHVMQRPDFCGEACVEMVLRKLGSQGTQDDVFNWSGLDPALGRGCYSSDLQRALNRIGFATGNVFDYVRASQADTDLQVQWKRLHADLVSGHPSIVCMRSDRSAAASEHMRLIIGYNSRSDSVIYLDPADQGAQQRSMIRTEFLSLWPLKYEAARWLVVRFRMEPRQLQVPPVIKGFTNADYAQHVHKLRKRLPAGFTLRIEPPFVVVGDGPEREIEAICANTVRWAVAKLKQDFFVRDPDEIITVWLFKDDESYQTHTQTIFGDRPTTPFGYYSPASRALVMNIATGTGTLVHEIVHPYIRANFPRCPAWFNEGLGSLYEQSGERDGHIVGYPNWRLPGLQRAIRAGRVISLEELTATSTREFYGEDKGTNYAQSRYLCHYLQHKGKLTTFYRQFASHSASDPTGFRTLASVLEVSDVAAFEAEWQEYVLNLTQ